MTPTAILCADLHLRQTVPVCRKDDYLLAMVNKLKFIQDLSKVHKDIPVLCAGDVFDTWKGDRILTLLTLAHALLPDYFVCVAGQHDLPNHSYEHASASPLFFLHNCLRAIVLSLHTEYVTWKQGPSHLNVKGLSWEDEDKSSEPVDVLLLHRMVWHKKKPFPGAPDKGSAISILKQFPYARCIVTGDNHEPFIVRKKDRVLVNCGSMMRMDITQEDYKPCVYLYDHNTTEVEPVPLPISDDVMDTEIVRKAKEKEERIEEFRSIILDSSESVTLDYRKNLEDRLPSLSPDVAAIVLECID